MERATIHQECNFEIFRLIGASRNKDELFALLRDFFGNLGFGALAYLLPSKTDPGRIEMVAFGYPQGWMDKYQAESFDMVDPFPRLVARGGHPIRLSAISKGQSLSREQNSFLDQARSHGMTDGLLVPTFGPRQHLALFGLGQIENSSVLDNANVHGLQAVAQAAHIQLDRFEASGATSRPNLSNREVSIIHWIALGKTNGEIADILDLRTPTVATYIKRIFQKLDVTDRSAAASKAIKAGIIDI